MTPPAVEIKNLYFRYQGSPGELFSDFNLTIKENERFGLFGPNGAGKTTLMNLMTGLLPVHSGSIRIFGNELRNSKTSVKHLFGFIPQDLSFYQELSPIRNLEFFGAWSGMNKKQIKARSTALLEMLGLKNMGQKAIHKLSTGMKRRVNLAIGVLNHPKILFLDEPTVGVDVQTRRIIIDFLKELNNQGTTLIYTSHQLAEAEGLCENVALIDEGKIIVHDDLAQLLQKHGIGELEDLYLNLTLKKSGNGNV